MSNEDTIRGLRDALAHDLPSDMRAGIVASIELLSGKAEPRPAPPTPLGPGFVAKVTLHGQPFPHPTTSNPRRPF
jgi:hypothetical protein